MQKHVTMGVNKQIASNAYYINHQTVVRVWRIHQQLNRFEQRRYIESRSPHTLMTSRNSTRQQRLSTTNRHAPHLGWHEQRVQTDAAACIDVGMINGRDETCFRRFQRIADSSQSNNKTAIEFKRVYDTATELKDAVETGRWRMVCQWCLE